MHFLCFYLFFELSFVQPDNHIGWATPMPFASIYPTHPRTNSWNCCEKKLRISGAGTWQFLCFWFSDIGFFNFFFFPNENHLGFHMRYHLFLHNGWLLQNLEKDFVRTNMHTTVSLRMTKNFTRDIFKWKELSLCSFAQPVPTVNFFLTWDKSPDSTVNWSRIDQI